MRPLINSKVWAYKTHLDVLDTNTDADEAWVSARVGVDALLDERLDAAKTGCGLYGASMSGCVAVTTGRPVLTMKYLTVCGRSAAYTSFVV